MSSITWTPDALRSDLKSYAGECWRVVESQYVVSTLPLVDNLDEQTRLEELIGETKPPVPAECRHLHPLLYTPFRYVPKNGSRFRRAGQKEGAFYTAERVETAVAELAFYRVLFFAESPATPLPSNASEYTAFSVGVATDSLIDISGTADPSLTHWHDYSATQAFADAARAAGVEGIRTTSRRCPNSGAVLSWLSCRIFTKPHPIAFQTWHLRVMSGGVQAICENPRVRIQFDRETFTPDPRLAEFKWGVP